MNNTSAKTAIDAIIRASNEIGADLTAAFAAMDDALAGWPTSTPGAAPAQAAPASPCRDVDCTHIRPCPIHDDEPVQLTPVETFATRSDIARREREAVLTNLRKLRRLSDTTLRIVRSWAHPGLNEKQIRERLTAIDAAIWCTNCSRYGRHEPRDEGHTECQFCRKFRADYKQPCPKEIWEARDARNGRIDLTTIQRILRKLDTERKARKNTTKNPSTRHAAGQVP